MILTIDELENALSNWPPETPVEIVHETHVVSRIETIRVAENGTVQIVAND